MLIDHQLGRAAYVDISYHRLMLIFVFHGFADLVRRIASKIAETFYQHADYQNSATNNPKNRVYSEQYQHQNNRNYYHHNRLSIMLSLQFLKG